MPLGWEGGLVGSCGLDDEALRMPVRRREGCRPPSSTKAFGSTEIQSQAAVPRSTKWMAGFLCSLRLGRGGNCAFFLFFFASGGRVAAEGLRSSVGIVLVGVIVRRTCGRIVQDIVGVVDEGRWLFPFVERGARVGDSQAHRVSDVQFFAPGGYFR